MWHLCTSHTLALSELYVRVNSTWRFIVAPSRHKPRAHLRKQKGEVHEAAAMTVTCRSHVAQVADFALPCTDVMSSGNDHSMIFAERMLEMVSAGGKKTCESMNSCMHCCGSRFANALSGLRHEQSRHGHIFHELVRSLHTCPRIRFNRTTCCQWSRVRPLTTCQHVAFITCHACCRLHELAPGMICEFDFRSYI